MSLYDDIRPPRDELRTFKINL